MYVSVHSGQIYYRSGEMLTGVSLRLFAVVHQHRYLRHVLLTRALGSSCAGRWLLLLRHPWAMVSVTAKCRRSPPCCLHFTWGDKLLVQSHYRGLHSGCLSSHGALSLSLQFSLWLSAYLSVSKNLMCVFPHPPHSPCILMNPFSHYISISLQPLNLFICLGNKGQCG